MKSVIKVLAEKYEGKRPLERPRCIWKDNTKNLKEIVWGCGFNWLTIRDCGGSI
jgi:hypothetical protein